jgi:hypothetical protein
MWRNPQNPNGHNVSSAWLAPKGQDGANVPSALKSLSQLSMTGQKRLLARSPS